MSSKKYKGFDRDKLNNILKNAEVLKTGENGAIMLDSKNWGHLIWWLDDDDGDGFNKIDFAETNKKSIINLAEKNDIPLYKSFDIIFSQFKNQYLK